MNELDKKIIKDVLAAIVFICASYISLSIHKDMLLFYIFGIAFLIAGVYGFVCISKRVGFIFSQF